MANQDALKVIGLISMVIDHLAVVLGSDCLFYSEMRFLGRLALPCFACGIVQGLELTSDVKKYITRLLVLGVVSQPFYYWAINPNGINDVFGLALGLCCARIMQKNVYLPWLVVVLGNFAGISPVGPAFVLLISTRDIYFEVIGALVLAWIFLYLTGEWFYLGIVLWIGFRSVSALGPKFEFKKRVPKWFFYFFYPVHMVGLKQILISLT